MNFGVLGYGKIVREQIAPAFAQTAHQIVSVGSRSGQRPAGYAGVVHDSYADCINDPQVEAIYIATPNHLHVPLSIQALKAGKPVLCEKPAALSADEFAQLETAQAETGVAYQEAFMVEHHPQWADLNTEALGANRLLHTSFTYGPRKSTDVRSHAELGGGVWYDIGCYGLWACYRFGARHLRRVSGTFRTQDGVCVHAQFTLEFDELDAQIEVGSLHWRQQSLTLVTKQERIDVPWPFNPEGPVIQQITDQDGSRQAEFEGNQYANMLNDFAQHCDSGQFLYHDRSAHIAAWSDQILSEVGKN